MLHHLVVVIGALLSFLAPMLDAVETCQSTGLPGMPALRQGPNTHKGGKGDPGPVGPDGKRGESGREGPPGLQGIMGHPGEPGEGSSVVPEMQSAFSAARGTTAFPDRSSIIRFTTVITNINNDYDPLTGRFRCRVAGTYYFVFHASTEDRLCVVLKLDQSVLASFCDHLYKHNVRQASSGGLAVYVNMNQEVWLETKDYRGMTGKPAGYSIFSGFLLHAH
ncbi:complement C1q subcomponent subunit C [Diretmus argenteus]